MAEPHTSSISQSPPRPTYAQVTARQSVAADSSMPTPRQGQVLKHSIFSAAFIRCFSIGDGNCFIHSLAYALNYRNYRVADSHTRKDIAVQLRAGIITEEAWQTFLTDRGYTEGEGAPTYADAVDYRSHVGDFVYNFVAYRLGIVIVALKSTDNIFCTRDIADIGPNDPIFMLAWINDNHYEAICRFGTDIEPPTEEERTAVRAVFEKVNAGEEDEHTERCFSDTDNVRGVFFHRWKVMQNIFKIMAETRSRSN